MAQVTVGVSELFRFSKRYIPKRSVIPSPAWSWKKIGIVQYRVSCALRRDIEDLVAERHSVRVSKSDLESGGAAAEVTTLHHIYLI